MMRSYETPDGILELDSDDELTSDEVKAIVAMLMKEDDNA